ncbi:MAG: DUF2283 domain-containing protein [Planctomycetota bacterium]|nr:DUF2283 domain-containing protein [Planctomycetota bacterium]
MALTELKNLDVQGLLRGIPGFLKVPASRYWVDYDEEADVLYISFRKPQHATESELTEDGVIVRTEGKKVVGITILNASKR